MVQIKNVWFSSTIQLDAAKAVVASNIGTGVDVTIQWVDPVERTANLYIASANSFITINGANKVVCGSNSQTFLLMELENGNIMIKPVASPARLLIINKALAPVTNELPPASGAGDFDKQYWTLV